MSKTGYVSPWIGLTQAVEHAALVERSDKAWPKVSQAIRDGKLNARGLIGGFVCDLNKQWFWFLAFDDHDSDCLFFYQDQPPILDPPAPDIVEQVEVNSEQVEKIWGKGAGKQADKRAKEKKERGRPEGTGYQKADAPLLEEMNKLMVAGDADGPWQAAGRVVEKAIGGGTEDSKKKRLIKAYSYKHRPQRNST